MLKLKKISQNYKNYPKCKLGAISHPALEAADIKRKKNLSSIWSTHGLDFLTLTVPFGWLLSQPKRASDGLSTNWRSPDIEPTHCRELGSLLTKGGRWEAQVHPLCPGEGGKPRFTFSSYTVLGTQLCPQLAKMWLVTTHVTFPTSHCVMGTSQNKAFARASRILKYNKPSM